MTNDNSIGARIKALRKRKGLTQVQLANAVGCLDYQCVSKWENNIVNPSLAPFLNLCKFFSVSMSWLKTGKEIDGKSGGVFILREKRSDDGLYKAVLGYISQPQYARTFTLAEAKNYNAENFERFEIIPFEKTNEN